MAFYRDTEKKTRQQRRTIAENRGGFEDEGRRYGRGDRPQGERSFGDRPRGGKPYGDRPQGQRSFDDRPRGGKPYGDKPAYGDRPQGQRSFDDRPRSGKSYGDKPQGQRAYGDRPQGERSFGDRPRGGKPYGDRPAYGDRPQGQRSFDDRPRSGKPYGDRPQGQRSFNDRPRSGKPYGDKPSYGDRSQGQRSFDDRPRGGKPYGDKPSYGDRPQPQRPSYDRPHAPRPVGPAYDRFRYAPPAAPTPPPAPVAEPDDLVPEENLLSGRNPIREALKSGRDIEKLLVQRGELSGSAREIIQMAKERHIPVQEVDHARLDAIAANHQGMLAFASAYQYSTVEKMLALAEERGEPPFLVILDGVTDPHNLGAIIRTAECAGAHGVIVQERRAVGLTPAAVKASAGAVEYVPVARVTNLVAVIEQLQKKNVWVYAADMRGEDYAAVDLSGAVALVVGAEGEGVSRLVRERCDRALSLPIRGKLDSLNASVAAGILLYAVMRAR